MTRTNLDSLVDQVKAGVLGIVLSTVAFLLWSTFTRQALSNCIDYLVRNGPGQAPRVHGQPDPHRHKQHPASPVDLDRWLCIQLSVGDIFPVDFLVF